MFERSDIAKLTAAERHYTDHTGKEEMQIMFIGHLIFKKQKYVQDTETGKRKKINDLSGRAK